MYELSLKSEVGSPPGSPLSLSQKVNFGCRSVWQWTWVYLRPPRTTSRIPAFEPHSALAGSHIRAQASEEAGVSASAVKWGQCELRSVAAGVRVEAGGEMKVWVSVKRRWATDRKLWKVAG